MIPTVRMKRVFIISAALLALSGTLLFSFGADATSAAFAFAPQNPPEMQPITNRNSPAHLAAKLFMRGANLGNYLEAPPGQNWGVTVSANEFAIMRSEGFDHVRLPVSWHHYAGSGPQFTLSP